MPDLDIRSVEQALRAAGLSRRQARALLGGGWSAVVGELRAERDELALELDQLRVQLLAPTIEPLVPVAVAQDRGPPSGDADSPLP